MHSYRRASWRPAAAAPARARPCSAERATTPTDCRLIPAVSITLLLVIFYYYSSTLQYHAHCKVGRRNPGIYCLILWHSLFLQRQFRSPFSLEVMHVECRNSKPHFASLPERKNVNITFHSASWHRQYSSVYSDTLVPQRDL